jgi:hypothetical protein
MYELSNKSIVFSPRKTSGEKIKSLVPAFILTAAGTFAIWVFEKIKYTGERTVSYVNDASELLMEKATSGAAGVMSSAPVNPGELLTPHPTPFWAWFLGGALLAILIVSVVNWSKL